MQKSNFAPRSLTMQIPFPSRTGFYSPQKYTPFLTGAYVINNIHNSREAVVSLGVDLSSKVDDGIVLETCFFWERRRWRAARTCGRGDFLRIADSTKSGWWLECFTDEKFSSQNMMGKLPTFVLHINHCVSHFSHPLSKKRTHSGSHVQPTKAASSA